MYVTTQFSVFMVNKPGILAHILGEFAGAKVNITAMTVMDSVEHGVLRVVLDDPRKAEEVLIRANMTFNKTDVLCVILENHAGAFAGVAERLAANHINISYAYCTAGAKGGRTTGILKVADVKKAMKVIQGNIKRLPKSQPQLRRPQRV
ncbi:MAG: ACT domain-containing protein [Sedimentisphaerales bacterium]|nr:ACT domain-containing protein [Sedimentisphaerales bacterium]